MASNVRGESFLIAGASLAGATAATALREEGSKVGSSSSVTYGSGLYERPPLSKDYLHGKSEKDKIYVHPRGLVRRARRRADPRHSGHRHRTSRPRGDAVRWSPDWLHQAGVGHRLVVAPAGGAGGRPRGRAVPAPGRGVRADQAGAGIGVEGGGDRGGMDRSRGSDLTIKGVTKPVTIDLDYTGTTVDPFGNTRLGLEGSVVVNGKDWGVNWNAALEAGCVLVSEKATLEFDVSAIRPQTTPELLRRLLVVRSAGSAPSALVFLVALDDVVVAPARQPVGLALEIAIDADNCRVALRRTQSPVEATPCGFESHPGHRDLAGMMRIGARLTGWRSSPHSRRSLTTNHPPTTAMSARKSAPSVGCVSCIPDTGPTGLVTRRAANLGGDVNRNSQGVLATSRRRPRRVDATSSPRLGHRPPGGHLGDPRRPHPPSSTTTSAPRVPSGLSEPCSAGVPRRPRPRLRADGGVPGRIRYDNSKPAVQRAPALGARSDCPALGSSRARTSAPNIGSGVTSRRARTKPSLLSSGGFVALGGTRGRARSAGPAGGSRVGFGSG